MGPHQKKKGQGKPFWVAKCYHEVNEEEWLVFQTHTITLSNSNILLQQSYFLTDAINFAKYKEKNTHTEFIIFFLSASNLKQIPW